MYKDGKRIEFDRTDIIETLTLLRAAAGQEEAGVELLVSFKVFVVVIVDHIIFKYAFA